MTTTTYGTIPISSSSPPSPNPIPTRRKPILGNCGPWSIMFDFSSFALPTSLDDAVSRIRFNLAYFCWNYIVIALLFPILLCPFTFNVVLSTLLLFEILLRRCPTPVILGRPIAYRAVLTTIFLAIVVMVVVIQSSAADLEMEAAVLGMVTHAALRKTKGLSLEEDPCSCCGGGTPSMMPSENTNV